MEKKPLSAIEVEKATGFRAPNVGELTAVVNDPEVAKLFPGKERHQIIFEVHQAILRGALEVHNAQNQREAQEPTVVFESANA